MTRAIERISDLTDKPVAHEARQPTIVGELAHHDEMIDRGALIDDIDDTEVNVRSKAPVGFDLAMAVLLTEPPDP